MGAALLPPRPFVGHRSPERTADAARAFAAVQPALVPLIDRHKDIAVAPRLPLPHEDSHEVNSRYHAVRNRPFAFNDQGYPVCIFLPRNTKEVADIVRTLNSVQVRNHLDEKGIRVSVCGGCHGYLSMASGCVAIDLQAIDYAHFDPATKRVAVGGGAKLASVFRELKGTGLGISTGTHGDTGVGGLTLAGGVGFLSGRAGMACDTLVQCTAVLATGEVVTATDYNEHKTLMRALRGGGGNFGIVTEFVFDCVDVSSAIGGTMVHFAPPPKMLNAALHSWDEIVQKSMQSHEQSIFVIPTGAPVHIVVGTSVGPENGKAAATKDVPFLNELTKVKGSVGRFGGFKKMPFDDLQVILEAKAQRGNASSSGFCIHALDDKLIEIIVRYTRVDLPPTGSVLMIFPLAHKTVLGVEGRPHCVGHRDMKYWVIIVAGWGRDAAAKDQERALQWQSDLMHEIRNNTQGGQTAHAHEVRGDENSAYSADLKVFLKQAKKVYDPTNFFRMNVNIDPSAISRAGSRRTSGTGPIALPSLS